MESILTTIGPTTDAERIGVLVEGSRCARHFS